ncbi:MAG: hypothetical protein V4692_14365 [Bdellovibrionota bacterium]
MKSVFLIIALVIIGNFAQAEGLNQKALSTALESESLKDVTKRFSSFELTEASVVKTMSRRSSDRFKVNLFYSDMQTAGGCNVVVKVVRGQMEIVSPGGGGFQVREIWSAEATLGACPR